MSALLRTRVSEWVRSAEIVDKHLGDFSRQELCESYKKVRDMFKDGASPLSDSTLEYIRYELAEEAAAHTNEFGSALRNFAGKISTIIKSRDDFKNEFEAQVSEGLALPPSVEAKSRKIINGQIWEGLFIGDKPVKKGTITYPDGIVYKGEWSEYGPDGKGTLVISDKKMKILETEFKKGRIVGSKLYGNQQFPTITIQWHNGDRFTTCVTEPASAFAKLLENAPGVYVFASGEHESGTFEKGTWRSREKVTPAPVVRKAFSPAQRIISIAALVVAVLSVCIAAFI